MSPKHLPHLSCSWSRPGCYVDGLPFPHPTLMGAHGLLCLSCGTLLNRHRLSAGLDVSQRAAEPKGTRNNREPQTGSKSGWPGLTRTLTEAWTDAVRTADRAFLRQSCSRAGSHSRGDSNTGAESSSSRARPSSICGGLGRPLTRKQERGRPSPGLRRSLPGGCVRRLGCLPPWAVEPGDGAASWTERGGW